MPLSCGDMTYFKSLVRGNDISQYRLSAKGYGSHFGFDYRVLDRIIKLEFNGFKIEVEFVHYQVLSSATELFLKRLSKIRRAIFNCELKVQGHLQHKWILLLFKKICVGKCIMRYKMRYANSE